MTLIGILVALIDRPAQAMRAASERPRAWWLPAVLLLAGMAAYAVVSAPYQIALSNERSAEMTARIAASMPADQAALVRESASEMTTTTYLVSVLGVGMVMAAGGWLLRGAWVHFASQAAGGTSTFGCTFAACVWSMVPYFFRDLLYCAYTLVQREAITHTGLASLVTTGNWLSDSSSLTYNALAQVDPFALWHVVLLAMAIAAATRVGRVGSIVLAVVTFAVILGLKMIPVAISAAFTGAFAG